MKNWPHFSKKEIENVVKVLKSGKVNYLNGSQGLKFEKNFSKFTGSKYSIAISNGTNALELVLKAINLKFGDEVIVTSKSFIASASCVVAVGAVPIFADVEMNSQNISLDFIRKIINKKTKAIICVHIGGWPCDIMSLVKICKKHNIKLIEDCSQAHGAKVKNKSVGSFGDFGTWSFCNDKIISTGGEGGMITTNSYKNYQNIWSLKDHGKNMKKYLNIKSNYSFKYLHDTFGSNYRLTEMQSAIGNSQLLYIKERVKIRQRNANQYIKNFKNCKSIIIPVIPKDITHSFYRLYLRFNFKFIKKNWDKNKIINKLNKIGFESSEGACSEIYNEKCFKNSKYKVKKRLKNCAELSKSSFALKVDHTISLQAINRQCKIAIGFLNTISN